MLRWFTDTAREVWWVARCLPHLVTVALLAVVVLVLLGRFVTGSGVGLALVGLLGWPSWGSQSWHRVADRRVSLNQRRHWPTTAASVGLSVTRPGEADSRTIPRLLRGTRTRDGVSVLRMRYAAGQTIDTVERAAPALASLLGGHSVRVADDGPTRAVVTLALRDVLDRVTNTPTPRDGATGTHPASGVELGRVMSGQPWTVDARVHTLVAGATGSGKASVMWSLIAALAPAVRAGTVRLVGIDLKAGMELLHARALFSSLATTPEEAVVVLEREAEAMAIRAAVMAGNIRSHNPSSTDPHVIVVIDELAAITRYITDRDLSRRADTALRLLLTQGRAPGFTVWGWVQDPRKDTVPMRSLFPQKIGLRLVDVFETEMILGEGTAKVAPCHRIRDTHPGTGYAITEDGHAAKVRAHYATDDLIHGVNASYPSPHQLEVPNLAPEPSLAPSLGDYTRREARTESAPPHPARSEHPSEPAEVTPARPRAPRKPRPPRAPRTRPASTASVDGSEVA
ncbi:hypothetical protein LL946_03985 [Knoellia locipacati]|uniref:FtsK/SpoIIIE domain-containing protein n=1 Tax=Knoellia locipacati TaxID=882824 RepID=UPI00384E631B